MAVFRELTGNINFIDVTSLPTTDIKDQVIYRLAKGNQYLFYTYNKNVSKWIQIDKSVLVVTTTAEMLNDTTKTYYLSQVNGANQIGYYVVLNNTPTRLVTTKDIEDIKSTVNTANQNASSALEKATTAETNAKTALSTANTANSTASNANSVATTANTTANTAKEKADSADTKADTAISTANEALNKANAVASVYRPQPSVESLADLPKPSAITANNVYNIKTAFVTNADFIEGAGVPYPAGTNVAVVLDNYTYKYDPLAGFVDLSNYQEKLKSGENIKTVNGKSILGSGDLEVQGANIIDIGTLTAVSETEFTATITAENYGKLSEPAPVLKFVLAEGLEPSYVPMTNFGGTFIGAITFATTYNIDVVQITITSDYAVSAISKGTKRLMPTNEGQSPYNTNDYQPVVTINDGVDDNNKLWTKKTIGEITLTTEQLQSYLQTYQVTLTIDQVNVFDKYSIVNVYATNEGETAQVLCGLRKKALESLNREEIIFEESTYNADGSSFNIFTIDRNTNLLTQTNKSFNGVEANIANNTLRVFGYGELKMLPPVTSADSGKFLTVNSSGQWVATTVPNAETTSF